MTDSEERRDIRPLHAFTADERSPHFSYLDNDTVVFRSGHCIITLNTTSGEKDFLTFPATDNLDAFAVQTSGMCMYIYVITPSLLILYISQILSYS